MARKELSFSIDGRWGGGGGVGDDGEGVSQVWKHMLVEVEV